MEPIFHKKTFDNIPCEKQEKILRIAIEEFAQNGYENANINIIAKRAEISIGSIYKYFSAKSDLFLTCVYYGTGILEEILQSIFTEDAGLMEKFEKLLREVIRISRTQTVLIKLYNSMTAQNLAQLMRPLTRAIESIGAKTYTEVIRDAQERGEIKSSVDAKMAAYLIDNILINLQYSYACDYYMERFRIFVGEDALTKDDYIIKEALNFIRSALEISE